MKIKITNDEFYEIKMPEQIGIQEFRGIVMKFNFLLKNFSKFDMNTEDSDRDLVLNENQSNIIKTHDKEKWARLKEDRKLFVDLFNVYYHKSQEELKSFLEENNIYFKRQEMSSVSMIRLREYHKIKPIEYGLNRFTSKTMRVNDCLLNSEEKIENE